MTRRLWPFAPLTELQQRERAKLERRLKLDALERFRVERAPVRRKPKETA